jgi:ABC-type transporter Mla maintaining outer membrane lipid asymmetry ATPase subunit MlaF
MQGGVQYNIVFYDELLDSSFDEKGIELIVDILKERAEKYDECIYIISHRSESIKAVTGEVVYLEKQSGITTRVDFIDI